MKQVQFNLYLVSIVLYTKLVNTNILPGYRTDHSLITMSITMSNFTKGNSYWTFNNSLLTDIEFVRAIKKTIKWVKLQYASNIQLNNKSPEDWSNKNILFNIADWLFLETLLIEIRGQTISYATFIKRQGVDRQTLLCRVRHSRIRKCRHLKCYSLRRKTSINYRI